MAHCGLLARRASSMSLSNLFKPCNRADGRRGTATRAGIIHCSTGLKRYLIIDVRLDDCS
jgi:hypothetical protein